MPTFTPPVVADVPTTLPGPHPGNSVMRFHSPRRRGVNVYVLTDGTVIPPFTNPIQEAEPAYGVVPAFTYHGGHVHTISASEAATLVAAGYTVT